MRWEDRVARMGKRRRKLIGYLEKKSEKKRPLERQERRWMDNIKMDLEEI
jgi:hypothetical protein